MISGANLVACVACAAACASAALLAPSATPPAQRPPPAQPPPLACAVDGDCGLSPEHGRCIADPRANRQPPIVDQGVICFCDEAARACETLVVQPVPCESDASCAVRFDPRPHPVAASSAHPHERGKPCRDFTLSTTCERTNICTMHRLTCPPPDSRRGSGGRS
jgi:hypothetical protein